VIVSMPWWVVPEYLREGEALAAAGPRLLDRPLKVTRDGFELI